MALYQRRLASSVASVRLSLERRRKRLSDLHRLGKLKQEYGDFPEDLDDLTEADRWKFEDERRHCPVAALRLRRRFCIR